MQRPVESQSARERLATLDIGDLCRRLLLDTHRMLRSRRFRGELGGPPANGHTAIDFVHDAIRKVCSGERTWPHHVSARAALRNIIRSDISNLTQSVQNKKGRRLCAQELGGQGHDPAQEILFREERAQLLHALRSDPMAREMARCILDDHNYRSRDFARAFNLTPHEAQRVRRRLRKRIRAVVQLRAAGGNHA